MKKANQKISIWLEIWNKNLHHIDVEWYLVDGYCIFNTHNYVQFSVFD